ncbi:hypothetical protein MTS1_02266 [Microbacterium sp. TS-1]|nr:hypothetical protein MTS1_02266 [Microbacterium sp. TS-1]
MTDQMLNACVPGASTVESASSAPPCRSRTFVPPKSPVPTIAAMIMKTTAEITAICRTRSDGVRGGRAAWCAVVLIPPR